LLVYLKEYINYARSHECQKLQSIPSAKLSDCTTDYTSCMNLSDKNMCDKAGLPDHPVHN